MNLQINEKTWLLTSNIEDELPIDFDCFYIIYANFAVLLTKDKTSTKIVSIYRKCAGYYGIVFTSVAYEIKHLKLLLDILSDNLL